MQNSTLNEEGGLILKTKKSFKEIGILLQKEFA